MPETLPPPQIDEIGSSLFDGDYPQPEASPQPEIEFDLEDWLATDFSQQYDQQAGILNELGILDHFPEDDVMGIVGIDGKEYNLPSKEVIIAEIRKDPEKYQTKIEQGFTEFLLVPFAGPMERLIKAVKQWLLKYDQDQEHPFFNREEPLIFPEELIEGDQNGKLVYYPEKFYPKDHGGKTKQEVLEQNKNNSLAGWNILLLEDLSNLPRAGEVETIKDRKQVGTGEKVHQYLHAFNNYNEQALTPEDWIIYFIQYLKQNNRAIDNYKDYYGSACWLAATCYSDFENRALTTYVPTAGWNWHERQVNFDGRKPNDSYEQYGARSAVRIGELNLE